MYIWQRFSAAFFVTGTAAAAVLYAMGKDKSPAYLFNLALLMVFSAWSGALVGGVLDWMRYRRSPLEPLFKVRFGWYYKKRLWFRFGSVFAVAWAGFILLAVSVAVAVGETEEARPFFSFKGALLLVIFLAVFAAEGAVVGGVLDFVRFLYSNSRKDEPTSG
jgi:hypothetical protein